MAERQEVLDVWYTELDRGADSLLPKRFRDSFRKSRTGFTEYVMDQALLEGVWLI